MNRFNNRAVGINKTTQYEEILEEKNLNHIKQFFTPSFKALEIEELAKLDVIQHEWKLGDRFFKLANKYYQNPKLWFVIAHYNAKPTEQHVSLGETIEIPLPLNKVLQLLGY